MAAVPRAAVADLEERVVQRVLAAEHVAPQVLAYDTTNFFTHIATTNTRATLPQRGHSKQRRHDLRQLGLALVVTDDGQLPLGHVLYEGARPDAPTFARVLTPLRTRLHRLLAQTAQLTLVFDQGAETTANLAAVREGGDHYVTALKPSAHRVWLATIADQLTPVRLTTGTEVPAYRTRRLVHGIDQTVVVLHSATLAEGQRRGLDQHLAQTQRRLAAPRGPSARRARGARDPRPGARQSPVCPRRAALDGPARGRRVARRRDGGRGGAPPPRDAVLWLTGAGHQSRRLVHGADHRGVPRPGARRTRLPRPEGPVGGRLSARSITGRTRN